MIPKFAVDWIKRTSATGYLRGAINPNLRRQDISKAEMLCDECEQLLSRDESQFAQRIFHPFVNDEEHEFPYERWLRRFAISLAWRTAVAGGQLPSECPSHSQRSVDKAVRHWGRFLLGQTANPGPYTHNMFFASYMETSSLDVPDGFQSYLVRAVDGTIVAGDSNLFVYAKLPGIVFASYIIPARPSGWHRTRIATQGRIGREQKLSNVSFASFLLNRPSELFGDSGPSERQHDRMLQDMLRNPERALTSESYRAHLAERRIRRLRDQRR